MAAHQRSENKDKMIEELKKEIHDLKSKNHQLARELRKATHTNPSPKDMLNAAIRRNQSIYLR